MRLPAAVVLAPLLAAGIGGTAVALANRELDSSFAYRQKSPLKVEAGQVEKAVMQSPEPAPVKKTRAVRARCTPGSRGDIRNPWTCRVRYASGNAFTYEVRVEADGEFRGQNAIGDRIIYGCCVNPPSTG